MHSICSIELFASPIPLKEPFVISLGPLTHAENVIVRIRTKEGLTGVGECSPFPTINGENMRTAMAVGQVLAKGLLGQDALNMQACSIRMDKLFYGNSSIKSAFDMAIYDIAAQHAELPLYAFLGGKKNKKIETDYTVSIGSVEEMVNKAREIKAQGFSIIKLKLGGTREEDIQRVEAIREAIGNDIIIRIDANQGWTRDDALDVLKAIAPLNIQHCEEPISRYDFMELPLLHQLSPVPIMADESCCDHHDAKRLIGIKACDSLNLKLGKSSGIYKALKIIKLAEIARLTLQVGGFLESRLAFTASAHIALCSDIIRYYDFDTPLMFTEDPVLGGIQYHEKGRIEVPETPGLGASFDPHYLKRLESMVIKKS